jgi:hypothetical protein
MIWGPTVRLVKEQVITLHKSIENNQVASQLPLVNHGLLKLTPRILTLT